MVNFCKHLKESYGCITPKAQNHLIPLPRNTSQIKINNIPKPDYIHNQHPYYTLVKMFNKKIQNKKLNLNQHNSKLIQLNKNNIDLATDYLIKFLQNEMKTTFFLKQIKNELSYEVIDEFNQHYKKIYSIYDIVIQENNKFDYFILNVHIANTDIVYIKFITTITTDSMDLLTGYTGNYYHNSEWTNDNLSI